MFDVIVTYALFASGIVANKFLLSSLSPVFFVGIRMFFAGLILGLYNISYTKITWQHLRTDFLQLTFITLCTTFLPSNLKSYSLKYLPASKATLLGSIDPFITALFAYFLWNERLTIKKTLGIMLGFMGVVITIVGGQPGEINSQFFLHISYPELAQLIAIVISRYGWISVQLLLRKNRYTPMEINSLVMIASGFCSLLFSWYTQEISYVPMASSMYFWSALVFTILFGNVFGYTSYGYCLKKHSATFMALAGVLVPIFVSLFGKILLAEPITPSFVLALICIIAGLVTFYHDQISSPAFSKP